MTKLQVIRKLKNIGRKMSSLGHKALSRGRRNLAGSVMSARHKIKQPLIVDASSKKKTKDFWKKMSKKYPKRFK